MKTSATFSGYRKALMAKFIHKEVAGADKRAGSRAGQTAAWAGIRCLLVVLTMLIGAPPLNGLIFVARGTKTRQILEKLEFLKLIQ
jgi:hypothetical protein